ncbi:tRNA (mnm(5)s(2)U34)-methyltransferase [Peptoniphilus catoniae]|uniref:tRNA (mnm(5)s(2)U34)-methyltransferase n=1 Tax=Peptoniphilus catoniae TaxID=1660341 RepID=UPI0010FCFAB6|nr:class I SAM-dependent methyltransferase [Peptoniphilus catoniae]
MKTVKFNYRQVIDEVLNNMNLKDSICMDATCGNGKDSLNIIKRIEEGFLYCVDIQDSALKETDRLLKREGFHNYKLIKESHDKVFDKFNCKFKLVIYNLGYLPGSDKTIVTRPDTTIRSIDIAKDYLLSDGVIIIVSYLGHEGSLEERRELDNYLKNLDQKSFLVEKREFYNQVNNPPIVYLVGVR